MPKPPSSHWHFHEVAGSAADHHHRNLKPERGVWVFDITRPALVLGSRQEPSIVDQATCAARGIDVVVRRSGGGVMLLVPGEHLWVDVVIGAHDPLWTSDVQRSMDWLGDVWGRTLADFVTTETIVASGGLVADDLGQLVCFAGRGPGEVTAPDGVTKYVGISQRRTRDHARFQCTVYTQWTASALLDVLAEPITDVARVSSMVGVVPVAPQVLAARFFELISELD